MKTSSARILYSAAVLLVATGCSTSEKKEEPAPSFTQADLTGEWDIIQLSSNATPGWAHVHASLDPAGKVTVLSFLDDTGSTTLPSPGGGMSAVIDATGTVQLTGAEGSPTFHGTMTRTKTLVVGTEDEGSPMARRNFHAWRDKKAGAWPDVLRSIGLVPGQGGVYVVRSGEGAPGAQWLERSEQGAYVILEGESQAAEMFGFKMGVKRVPVRRSVAWLPKLPPRISRSCCGDRSSA